MEPDYLLTLVLTDNYKKKIQSCLNFNIKYLQNQNIVYDINQEKDLKFRQKQQKK